MKKIISLCIILMLVLPAQAFAHSKLTVSSPEKDAVVDLSPALIMMEFNTDIASLSTFVLENDQGETVPVEQINVEGPRLTGVPVNVLDNGLYNVKWTIIGADGHTVEGTYAFTVNAPELVEEPADDNADETVVDDAEATSEEEAPATDAELEPEQSLTENPEDSNISETTAIEADDKKSSPIIPIVIIVLIVALVAFFATKRNKK